MIEDLIERVFHARNAAHIAHWKTKSYAEHKALGHYYEDVIEKLDDLIEAYQGTFGIIGNVEEQEKNVSKIIHDDIIWLNENRGKVAQGVPASNFFYRAVKNEYRTKRVVGETVDNKGNWLPKDTADGKYASLNDNQKQVLKEFIQSVDSTPKLREFYNTKIKEIKEELDKISKKVTDKAIQIKLNEVNKFLSPLGKTSNVGNDNLVNLLQYYELLEELIKTNG